MARGKRIKAMTAAAAGVLAAGAAGCGGAGGGDESAAGTEVAGESIVIPGGAVFPEGVAVDKSTGDVYVSSTTDGAVYRASPGDEEFEEFLEPAEDGRVEATGLKVDPEGRLFVGGRTTNQLFVYDVESGELIRRLEAPGAGENLVNDLTFADDAAYVTDSYRDVVYRIRLDQGGPGGVGEMETWLDLTETPVPTDTEFGLNGISASDDGRYLLTVQTETGQLFRIDVQNGETQEVDLGGTALTTGDGLLLDGRTLLVVQEEPGQVVTVELSEDLLSGEVGEPFGSDSLDYPTTLAEYEGTVYVVNSQLDSAPDDPQPPFTVSELPLPEGLLG